MNNSLSRREAVAEVAALWRDSGHSARENAIEATLGAQNRWTEEVLNYAVNRWMERLTREGLDRWLGPSEPDVEAPISIAVLHGSAEPLEGLRDAIAVWTSGHRYYGHLSDASPSLLPAFAEDVAERLSDFKPTFGECEDVLRTVDAVMAQPEEADLQEVQERLKDHNIPETARLLRPPLLSVGVLDGHEGPGVRDRLAEDLLLYEGGGHRRLGVLWAPRDLSPDPYLKAMARFRSAFPVHPETPGALQMPKAFLEARDEPHAYAEGLQFLVSKGAPEPQSQGHVRWSEYDQLSEVQSWIQNHRASIYAVVAREPLHNQLPEDWSLRSPGGLHIPPLDDEEGRAIADFVHSIGS